MQWTQMKQRATRALGLAGLLIVAIGSVSGWSKDAPQPPIALSLIHI